MKNYRTLVARNEFWVALTLLALCIGVGSANPAFWSLQNLFDLLRSATVTGLFALGAMMVIVSGGIDVSFMAVAALSLYVTTKFFVGVAYSGPYVWILCASMAVGLLLGLLNAVFISTFKLPTFIVTLGTQNVYRGFLLAFIGSNHISNLPKAMIDFSRWDLFRGQSETGMVFSLPVAVLLLAVVGLLVWFILNRTLLGRAVYAMGGDPAAAERVGFNLTATRYFIYAFAGILAGLAGIVHASLSRIANPFDLVGGEMNVLAAVVLGGARISGGHGTVGGTLMGVALMVIMNNSLILIGVPSYWQRVAAGILILAGVGLPNFKRLMKKRLAGSKGDARDVRA